MRAHPSNEGGLPCQEEHHPETLKWPLPICLGSLIILLPPNSSGSIKSSRDGSAYSLSGELKQPTRISLAAKSAMHWIQNYGFIGLNKVIKPPCGMGEAAHLAL